MKEQDKNKLAHFHVIGVSYQSADVSVREQYSITAEKEEAFYEEVRQAGLTDVMVISTCNRTEIYFFSETIHPLVDIWLSFTNGDINTLMSAHFHRRGEEALDHLLRVSCGLESQIPGDFEIIMQVRRSFRRAKSLKLANGLFERMLNTAIHSSKRVKSQTSFSTGASSVSYAAVRYLRDQLIAVNNPRILLVGLGEIGRVALENLLKHFNNSSITLANRTYEKAVDFAKAYEVNHTDYASFLTNLHTYDAVIMATGASSPVILPQHITAQHKGVLVDLGVPSNVHQEASAKAIVVNVDDLSEITKATLESRLEMVPMVEAIVQENVQDFLMWYRKRELLPFIADMTQQLRESLAFELSQNPVIAADEQNAFIDRITKRYASELFRRIEKGVIDGRSEALMGITP